MNSLFNDTERQSLWWPYIFMFGLFAAALALNGLATTDIPDFLTISRDTTKLLNPPERQLFYSSPLNFFLGDWLHLVSVRGFFIIHGVEIVLMLVAMAAAIGRKMENSEQRLLTVILVGLTPLLLVVMKWFGKTDPVLIGGFFLCWGFQSKWRLAVVLLIIMAHRELGSLMTLSLYLLEGRRDSTLLYAIGVGNAFHLLYQYSILDHPPSSRAELMIDKTKAFLHAFSQMPMVYIMTMFSWYWVLLLLERPNRLEAILFMVALVLALMNEDFTRDFTLAALPATVFHIERVVRSGKYRVMKNLWPLTLMHVQVAAMGQIYAPYNAFVGLLGR